MVMVGGVDHTCWGGYLPSECSAGDPFQSTLKMGSNPNYVSTYVPVKWGTGGLCACLYLISTTTGQSTDVLCLGKCLI